MWTPYTRSLAEMANVIVSVKETKLDEVDWAVVKRFAKRLGALEKKKRAMEQCDCQCVEQMNRTALFKEELVAQVFHPRNVERWLSQDTYDMMFGC